MPKANDAGSGNLSADWQALGADTILRLSRASSKPGRNRIYVVGPYASRVNFFRQQNRALNLVWALGQQRFGNSQVAVIGTGLAGMTAAVALRGIGCSVTLYESRGTIMPRQRDASHRVAHPNVNFWPDMTLEPSTDLPFLNWVAADCSAIAKDLKNEWIDFKRGMRDRTGLDVEALEATPSGVRVVLENDKREGPFAAVVLATGFDEEKSIPAIPESSYWDGIQLTPPTNDESAVFVSGAGDGGLLETLRLSNLDFDSGRLIIEAAQFLHTGAAISRIRDGEEQIRLNAINREGSLNDDEAVLARELLYRGVLENSMPDALLTRLEDQLNPREPSVYLICNQAAPYLANAAPIHKLLLAHAIAKKRVAHIRARVDDNGVVSPMPLGVTFDPERTILRIGAAFNLSLLADGEAEDLEVRQSGHIDEFDVKAWEVESFVNRHSKDGTDLQRFVRFHSARAWRLNETQAAVNVSYVSGDTAFYYSVIGDRNTLKERALPNSLFGIPLEERQGAVPSGSLLT